VANIRTARRSGRILRGGSMRRESLWLEIVPTSTGLGAASTAVLFGGFSADLLGQRPFTIIRTRLNWHVSTDQEIGDEIQQVAMGIAIVSDQALAIGVTAVPTPFTDISSDLWFLHDIIAMRNLLVGAGATFLNPLGINKDVDSRAMRKVEEGQDLAFSLETSSQSSGVNVLKAGRMLIKLH